MVVQVVHCTRQPGQRDKLGLKLSPCSVCQALFCTLVQGCVYLEAGTPFFNLTKILYELSETVLINVLCVLPSLILKTALWAT